ncbi:unnamed protein product [Adineta steineri]|uniref:NHL repeat containing protein n=1 Tax=Adineta steineri TaxID=433720 RepID=A0A819LDG1_9BILA|nr:unnamed protein product [Adineta steineri]CAF0851551.1 unnamed protein product [Adineta steineri]CAF3875320.1 unnamed protein product [Adineta steineri]CAF3964634.1 unnamed protein product [Adineta steineri]
MDRVEIEPEQINVNLEQPSASQSGLLQKYCQNRKLMWIIISSIIVVLLLIIIIPIAIIKTKPSKTIITTTMVTTEITTKEITTIKNIQTTEEQIKSKCKQWKQNGITIVGGDKYENELDQLYEPQGILIDHKAIIIVDHQNHRILEWKIGTQTGEIIAGGNGPGDKLNQLAQPVDVILDKQNDSLIICDRNNERVMRWFRQNQTNPQVFIPNIDCYGLAMDNNGSIYVTDWKKSTVTRWKEGEINGTVVAGGNGKGNELNQLNYPIYIFVDKDHSLYISELSNHRVVKWRNGAKEGIVVAGGNKQGNSLMQLSSPRGVFVDDLGCIYVVDHYNHRIMRWCEGDKQGSIVGGGNDQGQGSDQLWGPVDLSFDAEGNLYVSDSGNDRIQKFELCVTETIC